MHPHPGQAPFVQQVRTLYLKHLGAAEPNVSQAFNFFAAGHSCVGHLHRICITQKLSLFLPYQLISNSPIPVRIFKTEDGMTSSRAAQMCLVIFFISKSED